MKVPIPSVGDRFGRLVVVDRAPNPYPKNRQAMFRCRCDCGQEKVTLSQSLRSGRTKACGCLQEEKAAATIREQGALQRGSNHPKWKGGRQLTNQGYRVVISHDHPRRQGRTNYVFEHVLVMEDLLGRHLCPGETVHHINGVRSDNRPGNLELWAVSQPRGQRVENLVAHAVELLRRYAPHKLAP